MKPNPRYQLCVLALTLCAATSSLAQEVTLRLVSAFPENVIYEIGRAHV